MQIWMLLRVYKKTVSTTTLLEINYSVVAWQLLMTFCATCIQVFPASNVVRGTHQSHLGPYKIYVMLFSVSAWDTDWFISFFCSFFLPSFIPLLPYCVGGCCSCICNFVAVLLGTVHLIFCVIFVSSKWMLLPVHFSTLLKVCGTWSDHSAPLNAEVNELTYTSNLLCAFMA